MELKPIGHKDEVAYLKLFKLSERHVQVLPLARNV